MTMARLKRASLLKVVLVAVAMLLAVLLIIVAAGESARAAFPGKNGKITFSTWTSPGADELDIHAVNPDGSGRMNLTDSPSAMDAGAVWSPDGTKIAFHSSLGSTPDNYADNIFTMNADGSDVTRLTTEGGYAPAWSPDGTKIAFTSIRDGLGNNIYVMNSDGSGVKNLTSAHENTQGPELVEWWPDWSSDGTKIVFNTHDGPNYSSVGIAQMNVDGSGLKMLTNTSTEQEWSPDWSPDGTKLTFTVGTESGSDWDIYVMDADGSGRVNLTATPGITSYGGSVWSPDGTKIAFMRNFDIWTMNADGSGQVNLTNTPSVYEGGDVDWQPLPGPSLPTNKAECKNGGYEEFGFKNQGRCVASVERRANTNE